MPATLIITSPLTTAPRSSTRFTISARVYCPPGSSSSPLTGGAGRSLTRVPHEAIRRPGSGKAQLHAERAQRGSAFLQPRDQRALVSAPDEQSGVQYDGQVTGTLRQGQEHRILRGSAQLRVRLVRETARRNSDLALHDIGTLALQQETAPGRSILHLGIDR